MKTSNAVEILNRKFGDSADIREQVDEELINLQVSELIYQARTAAGLTQKQLAELIGTKQPVIARLEDADYDGHSLKMLQKIAAALDKKIYIGFVEAEAVAKAPVADQVNYLGQLLHRKFEQWLESGWQTAQSLGIALQLPQFQYAAARSQSEPDLLEAEILVAENLANTDPSHPLASARMAKKLEDFDCPLGLSVSVSQVSDGEPVNVLLQLHSLCDQNLPADVRIRLLDEQGQPEYYADAPDEIIEDYSDEQTPTIYLLFKYPKGERFGVEISYGETKVREQFFI
jgi:transcriptional regulator with XRE-family HTH domain